MTLITFQDGKPVLRDGKVGTEQTCCCGAGLGCCELYALAVCTEFKFVGTGNPCPEGFEEEFPGNPLNDNCIKDTFYRSEDTVECPTTENDDWFSEGGGVWCRSDLTEAECEAFEIEGVNLFKSWSPAGEAVCETNELPVGCLENGYWFRSKFAGAVGELGCIVSQCNPLP